MNTCAGANLIQIKVRAAPPLLAGCVKNERASDLARLCTELARKGNDFPTIWTTRLKGHPLVSGIPEQRLAGTRVLLVIRLITGERLVFDGDAKRFSLD